MTHGRNLAKRLRVQRYSGYGVTATVVSAAAAVVAAGLGYPTVTLAAALCALVVAVVTMVYVNRNRDVIWR